MFCLGRKVTLWRIAAPAPEEGTISAFTLVIGLSEYSEPCRLKSSPRWRLSPCSSIVTSGQERNWIPSYPTGVISLPAATESIAMVAFFSQPCWATCASAVVQ